jgi:hypothetical protein
MLELTGTHKSVCEKPENRIKISEVALCAVCKARWTSDKTGLCATGPGEVLSRTIIRELWLGLCVTCNSTEDIPQIKNLGGNGLRRCTCLLAGEFMGAQDNMYWEEVRWNGCRHASGSVGGQNIGIKMPWSALCWVSNLRSREGNLLYTDNSRCMQSQGWLRGKICVLQKCDSTSHQRIFSTRPVSPHLFSFQHFLWFTAVCESNDTLLKIVKRKQFKQLGFPCSVLTQL